MNFFEYEKSERTVYADFAEAIAEILRTAILENGTIRVQQIQHRAKSIESLRVKLDKAGVPPEAAIEETIKDLAGCRIVLYSLGDIARLNNQQILFENFDVDWSRTKLHFPQLDSEDQTSQFIGDNYVVKLKADRTNLVEYRAFAGLRCEIQVQTILNHAWSETAHDTIYKRPILTGVGAVQMDGIFARMKAIQEKYLLPAEYEFQKVLGDFNRLLDGQNIVDADILGRIRGSENNNERVELLEKYESSVLGLLDDPTAVAADIRSAITECLQKSFRTSVEPIETQFGTYPGRTPLDVTEKSISILNRIRYVDPEDGFNCLATLYEDAPDDQIREKLLEAVEVLAKYELSVWKQAGPAVQKILLDAISNISSDRLSALKPLMIRVAKCGLSSEVEGASSTSQTFTWHFGPVVVNEPLKVVRADSLNLLKDLFETSKSVTELRSVYSAMTEAARLPNRGDFADELILQVMQDSVELVRFLRERVHAIPYELAESIEEDMFFRYRRSISLPADVLDNAAVKDINDSLIEEIRLFRDTLNEIEEFVIFKTLVGFESKFDYEWDLAEDATDFEARDRYRIARLDEYVAEVTAKNSDEWFERLNGFASIESTDAAFFPMMGEFVAKTATVQPKIVRAWLDKLSGEPLEKFKPGLLRGLYESDPVSAMKYVDTSIEEQRDLSGVMRFLANAEPFNKDIFEKGFRASIDQKNLEAIWSALEASAKRPNDLGIDFAQDVLLASIDQLDDEARYHWTQPVWGWGARNGLLEKLSVERRSTFFEYLENLPEIDYRAEEILGVFAKDKPEQVVDMFGRRLIREREEKASRTDPISPKRYDAIPFEFHRLHEVMGGAEDSVVDSAFDWSREEEHWLMELSSARFVKLLFPDGSSLLNDKLMAFVKSGDDLHQTFVVAVLKNYQGSEFIDPILREVVAVTSDDELLRRVRIALASTGVLHGEFGHRNALRKQLKSMEDWKNDNREPVKTFAEKTIHSINNEIAAAERAAREEMAMRKLQYDEPLDADDNGSS